MKRGEIARSPLKAKASKIANCKTCGEQFASKATHLGRTKFCSRECSAAAQRKTEQRTCRCGQTFEVKPSSNRRCCSPACGRAGKAAAKSLSNPMRRPDIVAKVQSTRRAKRVELDGPLALPRTGVCARPECEHPVSSSGVFYCSPRCQYDDAARRRTSSDFRSRDFADPSPTCRACGAPKAHSHHVVFRQHIERVDPAHAWNPDAALSLCFTCHGAAHGAARLELSALRDENFAFARMLLGPAGYDYLRRHYAGDDPRLDALLDA